MRSLLKANVMLSRVSIVCSTMVSIWSATALHRRFWCCSAVFGQSIIRDDCAASLPVSVVESARWIIVITLWCWCSFFKSCWSLSLPFRMPCRNCTPRSPSTCTNLGPVELRRISLLLLWERFHSSIIRAPSIFSHSVDGYFGKNWGKFSRDLLVRQEVHVDYPSSNCVHWRPLRKPTALTIQFTCNHQLLRANGHSIDKTTATTNFYLALLLLHFVLCQYRNQQSVSHPSSHQQYELRDKDAEWSSSYFWEEDKLKSFSSLYFKRRFVVLWKMAWAVVFSSLSL